MQTAGAVFGALFAGPFVAYGRWKCLIICNMFLLVGNSLSLYWKNLPILVIGKFMYGISAGAFNVFCPLMAKEMAPKEVSGPAGSLFAVMQVLGIFAISFVCVEMEKPTDE